MSEYAKVSIVLAKPGDWWFWIKQVEDIATARDIWKYVNPDGDTHEPQPPVPPKPQDLGAENLRQLHDQGIMELWREYQRQYDFDLRRHDKGRKDFLALRTAILESIPSNHRLGLDSNLSIREIIRTLRSSFQQSVQSRFLELNQKYELLRTPNKNKSVEKWFQEWRDFLTDARNCPNYSVNKMQALIHFHGAIQPIMPMFAAIRSAATINCSEDQIDLPNEIHQFEQQYAIHKAQSLKQHNAFGIFQGRSEGNGSSNSKAPKRTDKRTNCLCGANHRFTGCPYVNPASRPAGWTPDPTTQAKFSQPKHPSLQAALDRALQETGNSHLPAPAPAPQAGPPQGRVHTLALHTSLTIPSSSVYELQDSWIADTGSDAHVCNNLSRFQHLEEAMDGSVLRFGNTMTPILGFGTVLIYGTLPEGQVTLRLQDVAYVPGLHTNTVSMYKAKQAGIYLNGRLNCLEDGHGRMICQLHSKYAQDVIEYNPQSLADEAPITANTFTAAKEGNYKKSELPPHSTADAELWHARLAHAGTAAVDHLTAATEGVSLPPCRHKNVSAKCETCNLAKSQRQISRRFIPPANAPWEKVYFDFFSNSPTAYNGDRFCLHFICSATGWHIAVTMPNKDQVRLIRAFKGLVHWAKTQLNTTVKVFFSDNDTSLGLAYTLFAQDEGIQILHSARYADSQHGKPERAGGVILMKMRSMMIAARLPAVLWPLAAQAATYLINRTPAWIATADGSHVWTTPHERMLGTKPNIANLRVFGCRAYVRDARVPQSRKMAPRAWIGYLVGFIASNIWQIWSPRHQEVFNERDVVFDESLFYDPDLPQPQDIPISLPPQVVETIQLPPAIREADAELDTEPTFDDLYEGNRESHPSIPHTQTNEDSSNPKLDHHGAHDMERNDLLPQPLMTPDHTPMPESPQNASQMEIPGAFGDSLPASPKPAHMDSFFIPSPSDRAPPDPDDAAQQLSTELEGSSNPLDAAGGEVDQIDQSSRSQNTAQRANEISADLDPRYIVSGKRKRNPVVHDVFAMCQGFSLGWEKTPKPLNFVDSFTDSIPTPTIQLHRKDLPDAPKNYREMMKNPLSKWFIDAMELELKTLESKGTWTKVRRPHDAYVIPTIWVYAYKFDDEGFLKKVKARLCVQGNKQVLTHAETRAATLAARCFRTLMALTAAFGLDMKQFDAINAFVNSRLDEVVYVEMPPGRSQPGYALRLLRALYGLRRSPRLWQNELTQTLRRIGLEPVNEEPCLFTGNGIILLVYVDDLLFVYHPDKTQEAERIASALQAQYELRYEGEGDVFLGVRIIRDRVNQVVHLNSTDYIKKIVSRFHMEDKHASTPAIKALTTYDGTASLKDIHHYQQKIGSINYAAIATRPDVAKIASHLATFMTNPGSEHFEAANRVLAYLNYTQKVGIKYSATANRDAIKPSECFVTSSDAAFGDHSDRHSSEGYLATLYGGPIDWRASKQKTITTSSTEAELLAISEAGKTLQWWKRLFNAIGFDPEHQLSIKCDNMQTIRILCKDDPAIQTKLRHVDIHQHWLRQETQSKRVLIDWIPTSHMPADGLTKLLTGQRFHNFIRLLGLTEFI